MKLVILDNGHGKETPGKRSPLWKDGTQLFEWEFNRDIVKRIAKLCDKENIPYHILVPETRDVSLGERCRRANKIYNQNHKQAFLFSIHANAGGGLGFEVYTSVGQTKSDEIATLLYENFTKIFDKKILKNRTDNSDGDPDKEAHFYILKHTLCPSVLSENLFMDNYTDCKLLMSEDVKNKIAQAHFETIKKLIK